MEIPILVPQKVLEGVIDKLEDVKELKELKALIVASRTCKCCGKLKKEEELTPFVGPDGIFYLCDNCQRRG